MIFIETCCFRYKHKFGAFQKKEGKMSDVVILIFTGMGTVFLILILVVLLGNLIIRFTNAFAPAPTVQAVSTNTSPEIAPAKLAAIVSAVETVTKGKGRITSIEKMN